MKKLQAIVLAAGKSKRLNIERNKLCEKICGQKMILYSTRLLEQLNIPTTVIVGYQKDHVQKIITNYHHDQINFITQEEQRGTGHAILCSRDYWKSQNILIMNGDIPLVTDNIITALYKKHIETNAAISFVTAHSSNNSYGRVITQGNQIKIVEACEFDGNIHDHCCINAGIYIARKDFLTHYVDVIKPSKKSNEFYLTELIAVASEKKLPVTTITAPFDQIRGVNTVEELWAAEQIKRASLIKYWMDQGVRFSFAQNVHLDIGVFIGPGSFIGCGVQLLGNTTIGNNCTINAFSSLHDTILEDYVVIHPHTITQNARIDSRAQIGPFAHIRARTHIKSDAIIGSFVEIKNSTLGQHVKAKHLTYLGDTTIGSHTNIGAGTITCNYDGAKKEKIIIKDNTFIGSNNSLIAPLTIHNNAYTAAGSTITYDVPPHSLAIARARQENKKDYTKKKSSVEKKLVTRKKKNRQEKANEKS